MKNIKTFIIYAVVGAFLFSCQNEKTIDITEETLEEPEQKHLDKLYQMGVYNQGVTIKNIKLIDGSIDKFLISGDIMIPISDLDNYNDLQDGDKASKQYRTPSIISPDNYIINILGYTGSGNALTSKMRTALQWAVANYNRINTGLEFRLTFGINYETADMVVYNNNLAGAGGSTSFPSAGKPYKFILINAGTDNFNTNVVEHVITHEIAHSIGLLHQDWFDHQSCGTITNMPSPIEYGGMWIPGTPIATNEDSIMLACFGSGVDGEFSDSDILALEILYEK